MSCRYFIHIVQILREKFHFIGFNGRPNKKDDTCYTWWVGAALKLLSQEDFVTDQIRSCIPYVLSTQDPIVGGLAKWPELPPDPIHTYLGLSGLCLGKYQDLRPVDAELNISQRARDFLDEMHNKKS